MMGHQNKKPMTMILLNHLTRRREMRESDIVIDRNFVYGSQHPVQNKYPDNCQTILTNLPVSGRYRPHARVHPQRTSLFTRCLLIRYYCSLTVIMPLFCGNCYRFEARNTYFCQTDSLQIVIYMKGERLLSRSGLK